MKSKDSITADEKKLLEYLYQKACDIADYCHRNNMILPISITVEPDYHGLQKTYDYRSVSFSEHDSSGRVSRIATKDYNWVTGQSDYNVSLYEDNDNE